MKGTGKTFHGTEMWIIEARSKLDCARMCTQHCCEAFNWMSSTRHCELVLLDVVDEAAEEGTISYKIN